MVKPVQALVYYDTTRGEWIALVVDGNEVVCVGCEQSEDAACRFAGKAIAYHDGEISEHPEDMYGRTRAH